MDLIRSQEALQPSADSTDVRHVVLGALAAEREAIETYQELITAASTSDPDTAALVVQILADEEKHRTMFEGFLKSMDRDKAA